MTNEIITMAMDSLQSGSRFAVRAVDADSRLTGDCVPCTVVQKLQMSDGSPTLLAHVGETQEVSLLHVSVDEIDGSQTITLIGVHPSDAQTDCGQHQEMLSETWAGYLLAVLD